MLFVKSIWGILSLGDRTIKEGEISAFEDGEFTHIIKAWERKGLCKSFTSLDEAEAFTFKGMAERAAESLASLNPPVDRNGNALPVAAPTIDFSTNLPINPPEPVVVAKPKVEAKVEVKTEVKTEDEEVKTEVKPPATVKK